MTNATPPNARQALEESIARNLRLLMEPGQIHEIRVLGALGRNRIDAGYFADPAKAARAVLGYDGRAQGIYLTINPAQPDLLARAANRIVPYARETTKDQEIIRRNWLLIDFDPRRPGGISSSQEEHQAALSQARLGREWLAAQGWPDPILADSGNGAHLLYRIALPNDAAATALLKQCLSALQTELATPVVDIDPVVYNAARLAKAYGTLACKGDNIAPRPHRRSQVLEAPSALQVVGRALLEELARRKPTLADHTPSGTHVAGSAAYGQTALRSELAAVRTTPAGGRNAQLNKSAYSLGQLVGAGVLDEQLVRAELATAAAATGLDPGEARATIQSGLRAGLAAPRAGPEPKGHPNTRRPAGETLPVAESRSERPDADHVALATLLERLRAIPCTENGKPERTQLEAVAASLIEDASQLTPADRLRLQTELSHLGASARFVADFSAALRDARRHPEIAVDDLELPDGFPYAAEQGQTYLLGVQTDETGARQIVRRDAIAEFVARIVEEVVAEDGRRLFVIAGATAQGAPFSLEIGAKEFADDRSLKAALTAAAGAHAPIHAGMMRHVGPAIQLLSRHEIPTTRLYERTGWAGERFLIPGRQADGQRIVLPAKLPYHLPEGELALGLECLQQVFTAGRADVITPLVAFMLQAPLAHLAGWREERYALFIKGISGSLKTTAGQLLMSLYGPRFQEDGLLIKWGEGATRNALMKLASHAHDLPLLIDNFKPTTGGGSKDFVNFIHNALEGGDKDRLTRAAQLRETCPVYCWPLLTGEDMPDGDPASLARSLVVTFRQGAIDTTAFSLAQTLAGHFHTIGAAWIGWLETEDGRRQARWAREQFPALRRKWAAFLHSIEKDAVNRMRVAANLASNQLTLQVAAHHPVLGPVVAPYLDDHQAGLKQIATEMAQATSQGLEAQRFLAALRQLLASGRCILLPKGCEPEVHDRDRLLGWCGPDGVYLLPDLARQAAMRAIGDESFSTLSATTLYKQLAELDVIASSDAGRHTKQLWHQGGKLTTLHLKRELFFDDATPDS